MTDTIEKLARQIEDLKEEITGFKQRHPKIGISAVIPDVPKHIMQEYIENSKEQGNYVSIYEPEMAKYYWFKVHEDTIEIRSPEYKVELQQVES